MFSCSVEATTSYLYDSETCDLIGVVVMLAVLVGVSVGVLVDVLVGVLVDVLVDVLVSVVLAEAVIDGELVGVVLAELVGVGVSPSVKPLNAHAGSRSTEILFVRRCGLLPSAFTA